MLSGRMGITPPYCVHTYRVTLIHKRAFICAWIEIQRTLWKFFVLSIFIIFFLCIAVVLFCLLSSSSFDRNQSLTQGRMAGELFVFMFIWMPGCVKSDVRVTLGQTQEMNVSQAFETNIFYFALQLLIT